MVEPEVDAASVYNPYPALGAPKTPCWPRGFPMNSVLQSSNADIISKFKDVPRPNFGILQSLADIQPDVDAVFRLTHKTPFVFNKGK